MAYIGAGITRFNTADDLTVTDDAEIKGGLTVDTTTLVVDDVNNRVGIGTSSPANGDLVIEANNPNIRFDDTDTTNNGEITLDNSSLRIEADTDNSTANSAVTFTVDNSEAMRIDSSGNLLVGKTTTSDSVEGTKITQNGAMVQGADGTAAHDFHDFYRGTAGSLVRVGNIRTTGSSTAYNTSSDYRLKENVVDMTGAIDRVKALKPSQFNFIVDPNTTVDGFLAHEVQDIVPEAVTGEKDAVDAEGNPEYQGIDQSKLVPLLTGALQEAIARIETLEAEVATLKGAN